MIEVKLKEIIESRGISITEMSNDTGIARSTLTPIINNPEEVKSIRFSTLDKICEYLNVELTDVIDYVPNKDNFIIKDVNELEYRDNKLVIISAIKENSFTEMPILLSLFGQGYNFNYEDESSGSPDVFDISIEVMNGEEVKKVNSINKVFDTDEYNEDELNKFSIETRQWLLQLDRKRFRDITISILSKLVDEDIYDLTNNIKMQWHIGSLHFHPTKTYFQFEVDFEKRLLNDLSDYNKLNPEFENNIHFA